MLKMRVFFRLIAILSFFFHSATCGCPRLCECKWKSGKESVVCTNANLTVIPLHLDKGTQIIDLTGNGVVSVKRDEFSEAGLLNLQKVFMPRCRLRNLDKYAFRNLINLVELDLSYNELSSVPSHVFSSIPELRDLKLSGNPIRVVRDMAFGNLSLVRLELSDCKLFSVERRAFFGLETTLEWLKIDGNRLQVVDGESFSILRNLHGLELAGNPWNCSCDLRPLRVWMLKQNVPFGIPPICSSPERLLNKSWSKLDLDEFACVPEITSSLKRKEGVEGSNITITCRIAGIPMPNVQWLLKNKLIANVSDGRKFYYIKSKENSSDLTIITAELQDAGTYVCAAQNKAGRAETTVTVAVTRKPPSKPLEGRFLFASVVAGIVLAAASCLTLVCVYTSRKKLLRWRGASRGCAREDDYEKIELRDNHVELKRKHDVNGAPRGEIAVVGSLRRNGEYRVVPGADTDEAVEEEVDGFEAAGVVGKNAELTWGDEQNTPKRTRDDTNNLYNSTSGTSNPFPPLPFRSLKSYKPDFPPTIPEPTDRKYPDLLEDSSTLQKATSEGGDLSDPFCTLPRKRDLVRNARWRSTDSQSPLLPDSRYGSSSGGDSSSSYGSNRNLNNRNRVGSVSCLSGKTPTPLLDVSGLENRVHFKQEVVSSCVTSPVNANPYDYHAAQLEHFLDEYRSLQQQLTKMKESCDNMRQERLEMGNIPVAAAEVANRNLEEGVLGLLSYDSELARYLLSNGSGEVLKN